MKSWPIYGMFQPDAIKVYTHQGVDYIIMANEGDSKDYGPKFSEEVRVGDIVLSELFGKNVIKLFVNPVVSIVCYDIDVLFIRHSHIHTRIFLYVVQSSVNRLLLS